MYCANNPVNNVDQNGNFFLSFLIMSIITGAVIGGTVNAVKASKEGADGLGIFGAFLGGAVLGGAMGSVMVIGAASGLVSIGISVVGFGLSTMAALTTSIGIGIGAGLLSYTTEYGLRSDKQWTLQGFLISGILGGFQSAATFGIAFAGGRAGLFTNKLTSMSSFDFLQYVLKSTGKISTFRSLVYAMQLLLSNTVAKYLLTTVPASISRKVLELIFKRDN